MHVIYGERYSKYEPFILSKNGQGVGKAGDVLDDGQPKKIRLGAWEDEAVANHMAENIKKSIPKRSFNIWVESAS